MHHIDHWAVYETHDLLTMIAVCPACHDAIHHGELPIDDATVYEWKAIRRDSGERFRDHLYVEPGTEPILEIGSIAITAPTNVVVVSAWDGSRLSFKMAEEDIFLLNVQVNRLDGREVVRVVDGHVIGTIDPSVEYSRVPGRVRVEATAPAEFVPNWVLEKIRERLPNYGEQSVELLDIEVVDRGVARVSGAWIDDEHGCGLVINRECVFFLSKAWLHAVPLIGDGRSSMLAMTGDEPLVAWAGRQAGAGG